MWNACDKVTAAPNLSIVHDSLDTLKCFVILLCDRNRRHKHVNDAHKHLFTQNHREIEPFPPTSEALREHIRRNAYQAAYCWGQMMVVTAELPFPQSISGWSQWGCVKSDRDDNTSRVTLAGTTVGHPSRRQCKQADNFPNTAARKDAEDNASAGRLHSNARHYVTVVDSVLRSRICKIMDGLENTTFV